MLYLTSHEFDWQDDDCVSAFHMLSRHSDRLEYLRNEEAESSF